MYSSFPGSVFPQRSCPSRLRLTRCPLPRLRTGRHPTAGLRAAYSGELNVKGPGRLRKIFLVAAPANPAAPGQSPITVVVFIVIIFIVSATIEVRFRSWGLVSLNTSLCRPLRAAGFVKRRFIPDAGRNLRPLLGSAAVPRVRPAPPHSAACRPADPSATKRIDPSLLKPELAPGCWARSSFPLGACLFAVF